MATFRAECPHYQSALVASGFVRLANGRYTHPTLRGRAAQTAACAAWCLARTEWVSACCNGTCERRAYAPAPATLAERVVAYTGLARSVRAVRGAA